VIKKYTAVVVMNNPMEDAADSEQLITLNVEYIPGYPAKLTGAPEDCHQGEVGEINDYTATYDDGRTVPREIVDALDWDEVWEKIEEGPND